MSAKGMTDERLPTARMSLVVVQPRQASVTYPLDCQLTAFTLPLLWTMLSSLTSFSLEQPRRTELTDAHIAGLHRHLSGFMQNYAHQVAKEGEPLKKPTRPVL